MIPSILSETLISNAEIVVERRTATSARGQRVSFLCSRRAPDGRGASATIRIEPQPTGRPIVTIEAPFRGLDAPWPEGQPPPPYVEPETLRAILVAFDEATKPAPPMSA